MKRNYYFLLMAALVFGLSMSVTSCKDDDKDNNGQSEEQQEQTLEQQDLANARFAVLDQLADVDTLQENFLSETFEPGIGMPDGDDESTRIVTTNTMEMAAERFANIVDANIDENTPSYTWTDEKMGSMTYTKGDGTTAWATVDVKIKQVRGLQKIIFRSPEMGDENASLKGRAYYRFGDIIHRQNYYKKNGSDIGTTQEYWICVRPAFSLEGKDDSHWATVYKLSHNNYIEKKAGDDKLYIPTQLGDNKEHMQNLAEMLYAMLFPEQWEENVLTNIDNKKMKMFGDFKIKNEPYHNKYFWQNVCVGWDNFEDEDVNEYWQDRKKKDMWHLIFNASKEEMKKEISENGLHLLYTGYSWVKEKDLKCQLWQAKYTNGTGVKSNMHNVEYTKPTGSFKGSTFDCRLMGGKLDNYSGFFNNDGKMRWTVRFATGKELTQSGKKYSPKEKIPGTWAVYRYYYNVDRANGKDLSKDPEIPIPLF